MSAATTAPAHAVPVERLAEQFNACFESLKVPPDLFAPDVFFDLLPPLWRFQLQGPEVFQAQLRAICEGPSTVRLLRVLPTAEGFAMEHEETVHTERGTEIARRVWLCAVRDGRIAHVVGYCNGAWDDELRARHAAEAPMLHP